MKISELIEDLQIRMETLGDVEVTCTGTMLSEGQEAKKAMPDVFESTVERTMVQNEDNGNLKGIRVRLLW